MDQLSATRTVMGTTYIADNDNPDGGYWCDGEPARIEIERTDDNEIRIGVQVRGDHHDVTTIYLERSEAIRMLLAIAQSAGDR